MSRHWLGLLLLVVWLGGGGVAHATFTALPAQLDIGPVPVTTSRSGDATLSADMQIDSTTLTTFAVKGNGTAPKITIVTPTDLTLAFNHVDVGQTSVTQPVTIKNAGDAQLTITGATFTSGGADYTVANGPAGPLFPGDQATWNIACKPSAPGERDNTFEIKSDSPTNGTIDISLTCIGDQGKLALSAPSIDFGPVARGDTKTHTFTLSNTGNVDVKNISLTIDTTNGYAVDLPLLTTLTAGGNQLITVTFKPMTTADGGNATIKVAGTWGTSLTPTLPLSVALTGTEASYSTSLTQPMLDFGRFRYDAHPVQSFQFTNDGNATLVMSAPFTPDTGTQPGEYQVVIASGTVTLPAQATLAAGDQVTVKVSPQVAKRIGVVSGHIDITPSVGAPLQVPVTGVATAAEVEFPDTVDFGVVDLNQPPPTQTITIKNTGDDPLNITSITPTVPGVSGTSTGAFAIALPGAPKQLLSGESLSFQVTYQPMAATSGAPDTVLLNAALTGSLDASLTIQVTGDAVFSEIHGGGGCDAGAGRDGSLVVALAVLIAARCRRRRPARGSIALLAAAAATLTLAPAVRADGIGLTVFAPTPKTTGESFALQVPDIGARGSWAANTVVSYASNPLLIDTVSGDGGRVTRALVGNSTLLQLGAAYSLLDRLELGARVPLYLQSGDAGAMGQAAHGTALGDLALHAKARLWRGDSGAGTLVAGTSATVMLPTASKGQFTGSDQLEAHLLVLGSFTPAALGARLTLSINAGAVLRGASSYANIEQRSGAAWGAGASVRIVPRVWATAELFGELTPSARRSEPMAGAMPSPGTLSQVEGLAGVSLKPDPRFTVGLALGRGMTSAPGTPELRGVLSLSFVPGAAPGEQARPHVAPAQDVDTDGDGIPDARDKCPNDPEDKDGFQDADGCPDPDNDGDGIPDAQDRCPNDPEDRDGFQDADGCPDPDNDGDGIPDASDRCPNEPETVNGFQDADGCPDSLPAADPAAATKAAEATFAKGRELMAQSNYAAACTAFEQSQRLDPQFGTQFNLAICYEKLGKLATAWNLYRELARSDSNLPRRARAGQVAAALASRVPKLRLVLPNHPAGVQVLLNGVDASALMGIEAPVDTGRYTVTATAAGYRPWQRTVEAQDSRVATVVIDLHPLP